MPFSAFRIFPKAIAPTITRAPLSWRCCSANWVRTRNSVRALATTSAAFLHHAFDPKTNRFHNHMSFDRRWLDEQGSEDCHGRALWALGIGVGRSPFRSFQMMAGQLFAQALAGPDAVHLAARVGFRPDRHP